MTLHDFGYGNAFLDMTPKAPPDKGKKIFKLEFIKLKNFCTSNDIIKNVKRQHTVDFPKHLAYIIKIDQK